MVAAAAAETVAMATTMLSLLLPIACCFMVLPALAPPFRIEYYSGPGKYNADLDARNLSAIADRTRLQHDFAEARRKFKLVEWRRRQRNPAYQAKVSGDYIEVSVGALTQCLVSTAFAHVLIDTVVGVLRNTVCFGPKSRALDFSEFLNRLKVPHPLH